MNHRRSFRSHAARPPPPSFEVLQLKFSRIVSRHEHLKVAFYQLRSQIRTGLHEAEDVFASLATPLTKLVGLKTVEMAAEGRFSTVATSIDRSCSQEDNYVTRALTEGNELTERQKLQLLQLISLLKKIEAQVNSSQNVIFQNLANHQASMKQFFIKAFTYVSAIHQSGQSNDLSHTMLKILKATFDQVGAALGSVEGGIDDLMCELAEKMCKPMVEYVNGLKVEMKKGTCARLMEVVKEMDGELKARKFELEEARKQARLAEQSRNEVLSKLKITEETARKMTVSRGLLIKDVSESEENLTQQKDDQTTDDNLLWELLRKKRKRHLTDSPSPSPSGPKEVVGIETCNKKLNQAGLIASLSRDPVTNYLSQGSNANLQSSLINSRMVLRSRTSATTQKSPFINSSMVLRSGTTVTTQKVLRRKHITP